MELRGKEDTKVPATFLLVWSSQLLRLVSRCQLQMKSENVIWLHVRLCHYNLAALGDCFPVLQEDGFNEAKCEIPAPVETLHAGAYRSDRTARSCFSFGLGHLCSQNACWTQGREGPWWLPNCLSAAGGGRLPGTAFLLLQEWPLTIMQT